MKTIDQIQEDLVAEFEGLDDWMDRYAVIIDMGNALPPLDEQYRTPDKLIEGCQSRVWLHVELHDGLMHLQADSDAIIVKGIIAMLLKVFDGHTPQEVLDARLTFIDRIGLHDHLSPTRSNGLRAMLQRIRSHALAFTLLGQQDKEDI